MLATVQHLSSVAVDRIKFIVVGRGVAAKYIRTRDEIVKFVEQHATVEVEWQPAIGWVSAYGEEFRVELKK